MGLQTLLLNGPDQSRSQHHDRRHWPMDPPDHAGEMVLHSVRVGSLSYRLGIYSTCRGVGTMSKFENMLDRIIESKIVTRYYEWLERSTGRRAIHSFVIEVVMPVLIGMAMLAFIAWGHYRTIELERRIDSIEEKLGQ